MGSSQKSQEPNIKTSEPLNLGSQQIAFKSFREISRLVAAIAQLVTTSKTAEKTSILDILKNQYSVPPPTETGQMISLLKYILTET